jgi:hypothetical protein
MDHTVEISISVDNDAFGITYEDQSIEVGRILRKLADLIERNPGIHYQQTLYLFDCNGNTVGQCSTSTL